MKINEVLNEAGVMSKVGTALGKGVGGVARGVGAVAGGVAGIPGALKTGFQAGKATVSGQPAQQPQQGSAVTQAPGQKPGPIKPNTNAQKYMSDIGAAIRAGSSGDISARSATATDAENAVAPTGTKVNGTGGVVWEKTIDGWINKNTNTVATPAQTQALNKKWYQETQKQARQQGGQPVQQQQAGNQPQSSWDPKKKILTHDGNQYKKTAKGWKDIATDQDIEPQYTPELDTAFNQASGAAPTQQPPSQQQTSQQSQQPAVDVSKLSPDERAELIRRIKQKLGQA